MRRKQGIEKLTLRERIALCSGASFWRTKAFRRAGIPSALMCDGPHGLRYQSDGGGGFGMLGVTPARAATCFPCEVTVAGAWDTALAAEIGRAIAREALSCGVGCVLGPGVNIKRSPLGGRNFEYYSEDPLLAGELAAAFIRGMEAEGAAACPKHFAANSQEFSRFCSDSVVDERTLREIYLAAFERAVKRGRPGAVMCAYNRLNGVYCSDNRRLLTDILRREWGFGGLVITDWGALADRLAAFRAGCDLSMPGGSAYMEREALRAVRRGELDESYVNESASRVAAFARSAHENASRPHAFDVKAHHALALRAALEGAVLLKNENRALPLAEGTRLAVIGGMARDMRYQGSGSSRINPLGLTQPLESLPAARYAEGAASDGRATPESIHAAVCAARESEAAVIFTGLPASCESEGFDRADMRLPDGVNRLIEAVACVNPRTVVVLFAGSPVECPWADRVQAVLYMGLPGEAGGEAAARLLFGRANPCGKLAETWPRYYEDSPASAHFGTRDALYAEGVYVGYRYYSTAGVRPRYCFGHGLSYTSFEYEYIRVSGRSAAVGVRNTGPLRGRETVQLYVSPPRGGLHRPAIELRGFMKLDLAPGERGEAVFTLTERDFALWDGGWRVQRGEYTLLAGPESGELPLSAKLYVEGEDIPAPAWQSGSWYAAPGREKPDAASFEAMLGRRHVPEEPRPGEFTMHHSVETMGAHSRAARLVDRAIRFALGLGYGRDRDERPEYRMMVSTSAAAPLRALRINGRVPELALRAILAIANRKR